MNEYLPDATDFTDMELLLRPDVRFETMPGPWTLCPLCKGYGGWTLKLDAYGLGKHFRAFCRQCWGWGWAKGADATCIHDYKEIAPDQPFRCWHTIRCTKCGETKSYSSDD